MKALFSGCDAVYSMRSNTMNLHFIVDVVYFIVDVVYWRLQQECKEKSRYELNEVFFFPNLWRDLEVQSESLLNNNNKKSVLPPDFSCACSKEPGFLPRENTRLTNTKCYFLTRAGAWLACINCDFTHCSCEIRQLRRAFCILTREMAYFGSAWAFPVLEGIFTEAGVYCWSWSVNKRREE